MAGAWTSVWGSHMLSEFDQPMNLTRYHSFPHLNLESKISSTSYSSWSLTVTGLGCGGCRHSAISSRMQGGMLETDKTGWMFLPCAESVRVHANRWTLTDIS